jgi:hypothetical protein
VIYDRLLGGLYTSKEATEEKNTGNIYVMMMLAHTCITICFAAYKHRICITIVISRPDCNKITALPINGHKMKETQKSHL